MVLETLELGIHECFDVVSVHVDLFLVEGVVVAEEEEVVERIYPAIPYSKFLEQVPPDQVEAVYVL
jgi:Ni,Fe-hydrogenase III small subunit